MEKILIFAKKKQKKINKKFGFTFWFIRLHKFSIASKSWTRWMKKSEGVDFPNSTILKFRYSQKANKNFPSSTLSKHQVTSGKWEYPNFNSLVLLTLVIGQIDISHLFRGFFFVSYWYNSWNDDLSCFRFLRSFWKTHGVDKCRWKVHLQPRFFSQFVHLWER